MRSLLIFFLLPFLFWEFAPVKKHKVTGTVMQTHAYCGGAQPTPERMAEITKARVFPNKKCFIRPGSKNDPTKKPIASFVSDSAGNFSIDLPEGTYCIVDEKKNDRKFYDDIITNHKTKTKFNEAADVKCLKNWVSMPDLVFTVLKNKENKIEVTYHFPCSWDAIPCVQYHGPLPP